VRILEPARFSWMPTFDVAGVDLQVEAGVGVIIGAVKEFNRESHLVSEWDSNILLSGQGVADREPGGVTQEN
jgi:hypothetical protein